MLTKKMKLYENSQDKHRVQIKEKAFFFVIKPVK